MKNTKISKDCMTRQKTLASAGNRSAFAPRANKAAMISSKAALFFGIFYKVYDKIKIWQKIITAQQ
ncbi:MAG: hypothetical protein Q8N28_00575 [bacterium]|nr:hypothetical protein [bacterium]